MSGTDSDACEDHGERGVETLYTAMVLKYANENGCDLEGAEDALEERVGDSEPTNKDLSFVEESSQDHVWDASQDQAWKLSQNYDSSSSDDVFSDDNVMADLRVDMRFSPPRGRGTRERKARERGQLQDCTNSGDIVQSGSNEFNCTGPARTCNTSDNGRNDHYVQNKNSPRGVPCSNDDHSSDDFVRIRPRRAAHTRKKIQKKAKTVRRRDAGERRGRRREMEKEQNLKENSCRHLRL